MTIKRDRDLFPIHERGARDRMRLISDGRAIRKKREALGLTRDALAEHAKLHMATVWRIETGQVERSYARTIRALAAALGCDDKERMQQAKTKAPPPDHLDPDELTLAPEDLDDLPDPSKLPPEPLQPNTIEHLNLTHRAEAGRRYHDETQIGMSKHVPIQERVAATRVPVYTNHPRFTDDLQDAMDHKGRMRLLIQVLVVERMEDFGTLNTEDETPGGPTRSGAASPGPAPLRARTGASS